MPEFVSGHTVWQGNLAVLLLHALFPYTLYFLVMSIILLRQHGRFEQVNWRLRATAVTAVVGHGFHLVEFVDDLHALDGLAEHRILGVKVRRRTEANEEL